MRNSAYTGITLDIASYNDPRPLNDLKVRLDEIYFGHHQPHQWFLTVNGRTAMYLFLKSLALPDGSEVIVQSFTCVTAINPILWAGLTPIYADIGPDTLSAAPESLQKLITERTKVIILQHTFGAPGALESVLELAKRHDLIVLEDCAHALGSNYQTQPLGTFGDAAILSFGIEKSLSTKLGGALLINNPQLIQSVESAYHQLPQLPRIQSFLWLIYPGIRQILRKLPTWLSNLTRRILEIIGLLKRAVTRSEYRGGVPRYGIAALPGVHARVILDALSNLKANLNHRLAIGAIYQQGLSGNSLVRLPLQDHDPQTALIKFPIICQSSKLRDYLAQTLRDQQMYISTWYDPPIYPSGVTYTTIGYKPASCPLAESVASCVLNLPTGPSIDTGHATMIINELNTASAQFVSGAGSVPSPT